jgi:Peptidase family M50
MAGSWWARIGWLNLLLGAFNLLPALPMDGGRILRAALARHRSTVQATHIASTIARILAVALVVVGIFWDLWLALIGVFVLFGAASEDAQAMAADRQRRGGWRGGPPAPGPPGWPPPSWPPPSWPPPAWPPTQGPPAWGPPMQDPPTRPPMGPPPAWPPPAGAGAGGTAGSAIDVAVEGRGRDALGRQPLGQGVGQDHRAVPSAGTAQGDGQVGLPLLVEGRDQHPQ